jgi:hypothetical protein
MTKKEKILVVLNLIIFIIGSGLRLYLSYKQSINRIERMNKIKSHQAKRSEERWKEYKRNN